MKITRTYKFRLKPNAEQEERLNRACAAVRMIYNAANEQRIMYGRRQGTDPHGRSSVFNKTRQLKELTARACRPQKFGDYLSRAEQMVQHEEIEAQRKQKFDEGEAKKLAKNPKHVVKEYEKREFQMSKVRGHVLGNETSMANDPELNWIMECIDSDAASYALDALDQAWDDLYKGKAKSLPKFRNAREDNTLKYRAYKNGKAYVVYGKDCVTIPRIGKVPYVKHTKLRRMKLQTATVTKEGDKWYICVATTRTAKDRTIDAPAYAGIDLGTAEPVYVADSDGDDGTIEAVKVLRTSGKTSKRQKRLQREIARSKKGSNRRRRKLDKLSALCRKEATRKRLGLHQITTDLVRSYTHIGIEDLSNKDMTSSAKTRRKTGKKTASNKMQAAFNRAYLDIPKYMFRHQLEYKAAGMGQYVVAVDPAYTSKTCSSCGHVSNHSRTEGSQEKFSCPSCGHRENADANAAKNILKKAFPNYRLTVVGASGAVAGPRKTPLIGGNSEKCKSEDLGSSQNSASSNRIVIPTEGRGGTSFLDLGNGGLSVNSGDCVDSC